MLLEIYNTNINRTIRRQGFLYPNVIIDNLFKAWQRDFNARVVEVPNIGFLEIEIEQDPLPESAKALKDDLNNWLLNRKSYKEYEANCQKNDLIDRIFRVFWGVY